MEEMDILKLRNNLNKYGVLMSFTGPFSQGIIEEIGDALRNYLETKIDSRGEIFKVFSVFIEQTQNIKNYAYQLPDKEVQEEILMSGVLNIGYKDEKYFVSSGNLVKNKDVPELKERLEEIESYDRRELASAYREVLRSNKDSDEQGAGLGLIEMARKASEQIVFDFEEVENDYSFFTLIIRI